MRRPALHLALLACALLGLPAAASAQVQARVMHGSDASEGDFPWTVALVVPGLEPVQGQFCGGSLIDDDVVLTAAHCVMGSRADEVDVFAGEVDLTETSTGQRLDVASIHLPTQAEVDPDSDAAPRYDMAVLKLAAPVTDPDTAIVSPVQAGDASLWDDANDDLEIMGWGLWHDPLEEGPFPDVLQHATVKRVMEAECEAAWDDAHFNTDMVCALGTTGPPDDNVVDTCGGDSGGPLTTRIPGGDPSDPDDWKLVGTVSFGSFDCNVAALPGVYARAANPDLAAFIADFSDGPHADDPAKQIEHVTGEPVLSGTLREGQQISCGPGTTTWSATPDAVSSRVRLYDDFEGELITMSIDAPYTLTADDVGFQFLCEVHAEKNGVGGYGVARTGLSAPVRALSSGGSTPPPPPPPTPPPTIVTILPPPPDPQPFVPEPRDEGVPSTTRMTRRCQRRRCTLRFFTRDTTTNNAALAGVLGVEVRLTSRYRCLRGGRRLTCILRRRLTATATLPGVFTARTPRLPRGLHTVRVIAVDANGNREPRALTSSFRLRR